jgi:hypothetical protein
MKAIIYLKGKCVICAGKEELELDHIDRRTKKFPISRPPSEKAFWEEIKKCQVLCKKCHRIKSTKENQGENCPNAKLTSQQVKEIRSKLYNGHSARSVSKEYGVQPMQISRIKNEKEWKHVV